jgi:hypothetical protein
MLRWFGASSVFAGCALLALDGRWNPRITSLPGPGGHGLHALEALGFVAAVVGVAALWIAARGVKRGAG